MSDRYHLNQHIAKHSGARPYSCSICGKSFMDVPTCRKHEKTHDEDKPFTCEACGRSFRLAWCLKKHELTVHRVPGGDDIEIGDFDQDLDGSGREFNDGNENYESEEALPMQQTLTIETNGEVPVS